MAPASTLSSAVVLCALLSGALALPMPQNGQLPAIQDATTGIADPNNLLPGLPPLPPQPAVFHRTAAWLRQAGYPPGLVDWLEQVWQSRSSMPFGGQNAAPTNGGFVDDGNDSAQGDEREFEGPSNEGFDEDSDLTTVPGWMSGAADSFRQSSGSAPENDISMSSSSMPGRGVPQGISRSSRGQDLRQNRQSGSSDPSLRAIRGALNQLATDEASGNGGMS
ncbi:hypothetical protein HII31_03408 [Pseudocercospora fuligena]|uniref:Secreted protein n=1 Tax=Pseudocercospora fuligena TaxID=685502 RepID=A0A8H6RQZ3_9PEZI|nr:hypothetical protein HII31_03408 [Pseudocercospora fuligena]